MALAEEIATASVHLPMLRQPSIRRRLILIFLLQTAVSLGGLFYGRQIADSQVNVMAKLTRETLEHSISVERILFTAIPQG